MEILNSLNRTVRRCPSVDESNVQCIEHIKSICMFILCTCLASFSLRTDLIKLCALMSYTKCQPSATTKTFTIVDQEWLPINIHEFTEILNETPSKSNPVARKIMPFSFHCLLVLYGWWKILAKSFVLVCSCVNMPRVQIMELDDLPAILLFATHRRVDGVRFYVCH